MRAILGAAKALQGRTDGVLSLGDAAFDEEAYRRRYGDHPFFGTIYAQLRLLVRVLLGDAQAAWAAAVEAEASAHQVPGTIWPVVHDFWHGVARAAWALQQPAGSRGETIDMLRAAVRRFEARAAHCAENFAAQSLVLGALVARLEDRPHDAAELLDQAVEFAAARPLVAFEAVAHEQASRLREAMGQTRLADMHRRAAAEAYGRWGALAKVQQLQALAPAGPASAPLPMDAGERRAPDEALDLAAVVKSAQVLAGATTTQGLIEQLLRIALQCGGAQRGALVLDGSDGLVAHTLAADAAPGGLQSRVLGEATGIPGEVVRYVYRTGAVLPDEDSGERGADLPRSWYAAPLRHAGRSVGVLWLEHRGADGVFASGRRRVLDVLVAQAAVSLQNARLFAELEAENTLLRRDLVANVSHDLRTPLVSVRGYLELLAHHDDSLDAARRREYLRTALRQTEHLATLVEELFELAKLDFRGHVLQCERFAFEELCGDVLQKFRLAGRERNVELALDAQPAASFIDADLALCERALDNLISNALRHTPPGGRVTVRVQPRDEALEVRVEDTGPGIAHDRLERVFDRFERGEGGGGAGLGLAIVRRIAELHGGVAVARSDGRHGASVGFSLPWHSAARR